MNCACKCTNLYIWEFGNNLLPTPLQAHILWPLTISNKISFSPSYQAIWESTKSKSNFICCITNPMLIVHDQKKKNETKLPCVHVAFFKLEVPDKPQNILTSKKKNTQQNLNTIFTTQYPWVGGVGMAAHNIFTEIILQFPTFKIIFIYFYKLKG